jgi:hypothetical protein
MVEGLMVIIDMIKERTEGIKRACFKTITCIVRLAKLLLYCLTTYFQVTVFEYFLSPLTPFPLSFGIISVLANVC